MSKKKINISAYRKEASRIAKKLQGGTTEMENKAIESFAQFPILASNNENPRHIEYVANIIQESVLNPFEKKHKLLIISEPPRHGKSELISKHFAPWYLGKYPEKKVILTSYSAEKSDENSDTAKELFRYWGPHLFGIKPSGSMYNQTQWNTVKGGGCKSAGVKGSITGFGADVFIIDDYVKGYEEAESETNRENIWNWWQSVVVTRLHPGAVVIILATRWHDDDLSGRLIKKAEEDGVDFPFELQVINLPAISDGDDDVLGRRQGEALWPARYDEEQLGYIKKAVGPYWWSALYQGKPSLRGGSLFKTNFFRYFEIDGKGNYICHRKDKAPFIIPFGGLSRVVFVDPALETKKINDPTGMLAWGYSAQERVWLLLDRMNEKIEHTQMLDHIKRFAWKNNAQYIGIENEKLGKVIVKQSAGNDHINGVKIPFREIPTGGIDKYTRAVPMATYYENERVFHLKGAEWLSEFESNLIAFPKGKHDEDVDCVSMAMTMELPVVASASIEPVKSERKRSRFNLFNIIGRNREKG